MKICRYIEHPFKYIINNHNNNKNYICLTTKLWYMFDEIIICIAVCPQFSSVRVITRLCTFSIISISLSCVEAPISHKITRINFEGMWKKGFVLFNKIWNFYIFFFVHFDFLPQIYLLNLLNNKIWYSIYHRSLLKDSLLTVGFS